MTTELDTFETALLAELRAHVATRAPAGSPAPHPGRPRRRVVRRLALAAAAAAVAVTVGVSGPGGGPVGPLPAHAVTVEDDGDVVVDINRLEDAPGLETELRAAGLEATVDFSRLRGGSMTFNIPPAPDGSGTTIYDSLFDDGAGPVTAGPCRRSTALAFLTEVGEGWEVRIPAGSPIQTHPVWITTNPRAGISIAYEIAPRVYCSFSLRT